MTTMFPLLLTATFLSSILVCVATVVLFLPAITRVLRRRLSPDGVTLWTRALLFSVCVIGVSVGARIWDLERYMQLKEAVSADLISLEVYKTVIATAEANVAVMLLVCLGVAVVALMKGPIEPGKG